MNDKANEQESAEQGVTEQPVTEQVVPEQDPSAQDASELAAPVQDASVQDTPEQGAPAAEAPARIDREQRLAAYLDKLNALKESRTTLREVMERELLLEFVRTNRGNINEFPLLETQQQSVIDIITSRSEHPAFDHIRRLISGFITLLNHYGKLKDSKDTENLDKIKHQLTNTETLLIKTVQGVVYSCGLITDNFEELVLQNLGQAALTDYNQLMKEHSLGPAFWKTALERFVAEPVRQAHQALMENEAYRITKEQHYLAIHFPFDFVLSQLTPSSGSVGRTRIQKSFENNCAGKDGQMGIKVVHATLSKGLSFIPEEYLPREDLAYLARVVCVDGIGAKYRDKYLERLQANRDKIPQSAEERALFQFLAEQVVAVGVGAAIGSTLVRGDLIGVLDQFVPQGVDAIRPLIRDFSIPMLQKAYLALLEQRLLHLLRQLAPEEHGKLIFRVLRSKRVSREAVSQLFEHNLNRIRQNKIWARDPGGEQWLLFRPRSAKQLVGLMATLQLETELAEMIRDLWNTASDKVDLLVLVDLTQLARTSTNLRARLAEILAKLGIGNQKDEEPSTMAMPGPDREMPDNAAPAEGQAAPAPAEDGQADAAHADATSADATSADANQADADQADAAQADQQPEEAAQAEPGQDAPKAD